jgi:hypothetical protein
MLRRKFIYSSVMNPLLETLVSPARLGPYRTAAGGDLQCALDLYVWNIGASAALFGPLHVLEVTLRNAVDRELRAVFGPSWPSDGRFVALARIVRARSRRAPDLLHGVRNARRLLLGSSRHGRTSPIVTAFTSDEIVAAMTFGAWTTMLGPSFEPGLWTPALRKAFPNYSVVSRAPFNRARIAARFEQLRALRNRIMHYEPLIKRPLVSDFHDIVEACAWIDLDAAAWIQHHARFREVLSLRERPRHAF